MNGGLRSLMALVEDSLVTRGVRHPGGCLHEDSLRVAPVSELAEEHLAIVMEGVLVRGRSQHAEELSLDDPQERSAGVGRPVVEILEPICSLVVWLEVQHPRRSEPGPL